MIDPLKVGTFFFLILLGGLLFSLTTANLSKIPTTVNSTLTGFQTWRFYVKDLDIETWDSMIILSSILPIVSGVFMLIWSSKYETLNVFIINSEKKSSTKLFNKLLAGYAIATGIVTPPLALLDLGKIFTSLAVIHNYFEAIILLVLHQGGSVISNHRIILYSIIYLLIAEGVTILLKWPYAAFWFKFQGLSLDIAVLIQFIRIYLKTERDYQEGYTSLPHHTSDDERESEEHDRPNDNNNKIDPHIRHVLLLPISALFHVSGNFVNAVFLTDALA
ncbi:patatin-domain-containing protein [Gigaspora margarita]|uniref:Patatin-domain-containing protein n=1 Tax=Gigaspora margarita TaxID=4874 RepID=A0A8H4ACT7_GIGMA|nr:patatin-domain-containing protein [Gigaspora margarita]